MPCPHPRRTLGAGLLQDQGLWLPRLWRAHHVQRVLQGGSCLAGPTGPEPTLQLLPLWGSHLSSQESSHSTQISWRVARWGPTLPRLMDQGWVLCEGTGLEHRLFPLFLPSSGLPSATLSPCFPLLLQFTLPVLPRLLPGQGPLMLISIHPDLLPTLGAPRALWTF